MTCSNRRVLACSTADAREHIYTSRFLNPGVFPMPTPTLGEGLIRLGAALQTDVLLAPDPTAIDWTNVKAIISELLKQFGPFLISLFIGMLQPKT
jgi:hypothetical protein